VRAAPTVDEANDGHRFAIGREIGRGGMGRVLEATDAQFQRLVALKETLADGANEQVRRRFLTEALVTANLQHPGIPAVYARGERSDGSTYYAMQLVSGQTLAAALEGASGMAERVRLVAPVVKVAETVAYAHSRGVVHRDLKPENVILGRHGEVFLLDWGIAKVRGLVTPVDASLGATSSENVHGTQAGSVIGSPLYMAPEQARGEVDAIDERTDVFALGAMLYHVLTGHTPYDGDTLTAILAQAMTANVTPVLARCPEAHPQLAAICARAMAPSPSDRYASALEFAAALEAFQTEAARQPPSRWITFVQSATVSAVGAIGALLFVLGMWAVWNLARLAILSVVSAGASVLGVAMAVVEWKTMGRSRLFGLGMTVLATSVAMALLQALLGAIHTSEMLSAMPYAADPEAFFHAAATALGELAYGPFAHVPLALVQGIVWAIVARRNALAGGDASKSGAPASPNR
jgi:hypothetical protein